MIIVRALYGLKSNGEGFRDVLYDLKYRPSKSDPDIHMWPAVKENGFEYYEYVLTYVHDVLCISHDSISKMKCTQDKFRLKEDKSDETDV